MPYLVEAYDLYADAEGEPPRLLPAAGITVRYNRDEKRAWPLRDRSQCAQAEKYRARSPSREGPRIRDRFKLVASESEGLASFESKIRRGLDRLPTVLRAGVRVLRLEQHVVKEPPEASLIPIATVSPKAARPS
jgi:hypothetical protein